MKYIKGAPWRAAPRNTPRRSRTRVTDARAVPRPPRRAGPLGLVAGGVLRECRDPDRGRVGLGGQPPGDVPDRGPLAARHLLGRPAADGLPRLGLLLHGAHVPPAAGVLLAVDAEAAGTRARLPLRVL